MWGWRGKDAYVRLGRGVFRLPCNKSTESSDDAGWRAGVSSPDEVSTTVATVPVDVSPTVAEYVSSWDTRGACLVYGAVCVCVCVCVCVSVQCMCVCVCVCVCV